MPDEINLENQIVAAVRRMTRAIDLRSRMLLQVHGLTAPQLTALQAIARLQPTTASAVSRAVHLGQPTLTGILDRLCRRGLIERARGEEDRRRVSLRLTEEGDRVLQRAPSLLQDRFRAELSKLPPWERTQILATVQRLADMMDVTGLAAESLVGANYATSEPPSDLPVENRP